MPNITVLDQNTINKIAAGEVIERPAAVVKELLENAIDAKATAITVEIKDGGCSFIRVTDNGCGIQKEEVTVAFLRHSTSKIKSVEDLFTISSLGFRGEALASIASVSQIELITKTSLGLTGTRYQIDGGEERTLEDIGAPEGTTFIVRNLFYNTPARKKFLKTPTTEGAHVSEVVEKLALSHPEISIRFIQNNQSKLHTSGNHNLKDIIYTIFGREISSNLLEISLEKPGIKIKGYIGKPVISRGNRNYENYFINGRYIKSSIILRGIEDAYKSFMMQHKYPFTMLHFTIDPESIDVNVHPTKMELRFRDGELIYQAVYEAILNVLAHKELIPEVELEKKKEDAHKLFLEKKQEPIPEPFETKRIMALQKQKEEVNLVKEDDSLSSNWIKQKEEKMIKPVEPIQTAQSIQPVQMDLFDGRLLESKARAKHRLIGQVFDTYWLVEFHEQLYIIDQHAAHEKVLYEKTMATLKTREHASQMINPPIILTLNRNEEVLFHQYLTSFQDIGFEIEPFGGREYAVRGVPANLFSIAKKELLIEMIDNLSEETSLSNQEIIYERIASMSCKAAVKGGHRLSIPEVNELIDQLLTLDNPYACPHGRPTIVSMSKYEMEKKFKRIV